LPIARVLAAVFAAGLIFVSAVSAKTLLASEPTNKTEGGSPWEPNYLPAGPPASVPDAPFPQKNTVIDKKFIAVMASLGVAESLRITTHKLVLEHEHAAGAPWVRSVPANSSVVAKFSGIYAAELLVAYELKKPHSWLPGDRAIRKLWWVYPSAMAPMHVANGVRSIHTQPPSGCPPEQCQ